MSPISQTLCCLVLSLIRYVGGMKAHHNMGHHFGDLGRRWPFLVEALPFAMRARVLVVIALQNDDAMGMVILCRHL